MFLRVIRRFDTRMVSEFCWWYPPMMDSRGGGKGKIPLLPCQEVKWLRWIHRVTQRCTKWSDFPPFDALSKKCPNKHI